MPVYQPREDSFLLQSQIRHYAKGLVLDMGTGSGLLAQEAAKTAEFVVALDIDKDAVKCCKKNIAEPNIAFFKSNLFQAFDENFFFWDKVAGKLEVYGRKKVKEKEKLRMLKKSQLRFDLIIFNPPYLPKDSKAKDTALDGGKEGFELIARFFKSARSYLGREGKILIVFSSLTKPGKVFDIIRKAGFSYELLDIKRIFFENLMVYLAY